MKRYAEDYPKSVKLSGACRLEHLGHDTSLTGGTFDPEKYTGRYKMVCNFKLPKSLDDPDSINFEVDIARLLFGTGGAHSDDPYDISFDLSRYR